MAEAAQTQARALGFANVTLEIYSGRTEDFLPQLYKAMGTNADGWIAFGEARDAAQMVKTLKRQGYVPKVLYARAAAEPRFVALVGQDAEFILGSKEYDARFSTAGNAEFVKAFTAKWSAPPGAVAAAGYTALGGGASPQGGVATSRSAPESAVRIGADTPGTGGVSAPLAADPAARPSAADVHRHLVAPPETSTEFAPMTRSISLRSTSERGRYRISITRPGIWR